MTRKSVQPTTTLARRAVTTRRVPNPGVTRLRKEADNKILEHSDKIAEALVKGAEDGNASSARLLVDLADNANWTEHTDSVATVISLAVQNWKTEPPKEELPNMPLELTTNPPRKQLTNGAPDAAANEVAEGDVVEGELVEDQALATEP